MALTVVFIGGYRPTVAVEAIGAPSNRIAVDGEPQPETPARTQVAPPWWFADGRMSFEHDAHGVARVHYFSPTAAANNPVPLYQRLWGGFRVLVRVAGASRVRLQSASLPKVKIEAHDVVARFHPGLGTAVFETQLLPGRPVQVEIAT